MTFHEQLKAFELGLVLELIDEELTNAPTWAQPADQRLLNELASLRAWVSAYENPQ